MIYDLIIIGGGAAGSFAASMAMELSGGNMKILIIERNHALMRKLGITGKGRCNLTNNTDTDTVMKNLVINGRFLYSAVNMFSPSDTMEYFEKLGVRLKTERGNRVFPVSDKASDIVGALKNRLSEYDVDIVCDRAVKIIAEQNKVKGVKCEKSEYYSNKILLSTGGMSYSKTGSTGDGYKMAQELGHEIKPLRPALVPIQTKEDVSSLMGLTLKNVSLSLYDNKAKKPERPVYLELGEMLFTHFGISGPLVLTASAYIAENTEDRYRFSIDLKPALSEEKLDLRLLRDFETLKNKQFQNAMNGLLPAKLTPLFIQRVNISPEKRVNKISRAERHMIIKYLKNFNLDFASFRPIEEAVITNGGVSVKEINPKTMQSNLINGFYFAGEIIDVIGLTGGFNLQIAFSTAFSAVRDIVV